MFRVKVFDPIIKELVTEKSTQSYKENESNKTYLPISKIAFDPTQMILVSSEISKSTENE